MCLGIDIEIVDSYKYLGVHLDTKLDSTNHTSALERPEQTPTAKDT